MPADLPRQCAVGCKTNSHGRKETWRGSKLHWDVAGRQIPISMFGILALTADEILRLCP